MSKLGNALAFVLTALWLGGESAAAAGNIGPLQGGLARLQAEGFAGSDGQQGGDQSAQVESYSKTVGPFEGVGPNGEKGRGSAAATTAVSSAAESMTITGEGSAQVSYTGSAAQVTGGGGGVSDFQGGFQITEGLFVAVLEGSLTAPALPGLSSRAFAQFSGDGIFPARGCVGNADPDCPTQSGTVNFREVRVVGPGDYSFFVGSLAAVSSAVSFSVEVKHDFTLTVTPCEEAPGAITGTSPLEGTSGNDILCGSDDDDIIIGRGGDDAILGLAGDDFIIGGGGNDHILGGRNRDAIEGGPGSDTIEGGPGVDVICGNSFSAAEPVFDLL